MKLRRLNLIIHRDLGYFFFGMVIIYAISGIAINHLADWNPNFVSEVKEIKLGESIDITTLDKEKMISILDGIGEGEAYNKHFFPNNKSVKIYIKGGTGFINLETGEGEITRQKKRFMFNELNFLHYNAPKKLWTLFADIFAIALVLLAFSGLFIIKGKNGIKGRGGILASAGIILPVILYFYYI